MRKILVVFLAAATLAGLSAAAMAADRYDRSDRYERGDRDDYPPPPPPRRGGEVPPPRHATYGQPYFFGRLGIFEPNDDTDGLKGYDSGGSFEFGVGSRVSPIFAVDGSIGGYGSDHAGREVTVVPLTVGVRLIIPHPFIEPYIGGGLGLYMAHLKEDPIPGVFSGIDDSQSTVGGYLSGGMDAWLNRRIALNVEFKRHWANPTFSTNAGNDVDVQVGGWTFGIGVRVAF